MISDCCAGTQVATVIPNKTESNTKNGSELARFQPSRRRTERDSEKASDFFGPTLNKNLAAGY